MRTLGFDLSTGEASRWITLIPIVRPRVCGVMTPSLRAAGAAGTATLAALLLAACGSSSSSSSSSGGNASSGQPTASTPARAPAGASKKQVEVTIKSYAYHPAALTVASGTRITFVNQDPTAHTATATGSQKLDTGTLKLRAASHGDRDRPRELQLHLSVPRVHARHRHRHRVAPPAGRDPHPAAAPRRA